MVELGELFARGMRPLSGLQSTIDSKHPATIRAVATIVSVIALFRRFFTPNFVVSTNDVFQGHILLQLKLTIICQSFFELPLCSLAHDGGRFSFYWQGTFHKPSFSSLLPSFETAIFKPSRRQRNVR